MRSHSQTVARTPAGTETPKQFQGLTDLLDVRPVVVVDVEGAAEEAVPSPPVPRRQCHGDLGSRRDHSFGVERAA